MIHRTARLMLEAGAERVIVVTGYLSEWIADELSDLAVTLCHNPRYAITEMIDSIRLGLRSLPADCSRVILMPADVPMASPDTLKFLLDCQEPLVAPCYKGLLGHPILMDRSVFPVIQAYRGEGGLRAAIAAAGLHWLKLPVDDESVSLNAHTADEYSHLLKHNVRLGGGYEQFRLHLDAQVRAVDVSFNAAIAQFLELIAHTGSIQTACKCMQMSYSKGWRMIRHLENTLGYPVLRKTVGGAEGGGSKLTKKGKDFLLKYQAMEKEIQEQSQEIFKKYFNDDMSCNPKY